VQNVWRNRILFTIGFFFVLFSNSFAAGYPGFIDLRESKCVLMDGKDVLNLPPAWHKYNGFIKICGLKKNKASKVNVSIISIWAEDYLDAQKKEMWEDFPVTIIVDDDLNQLGKFPELYPMNSPVELSVYYGKWKSGKPTEIRIDVSNPAVGGDYYYPPLIWNAKDEQYHMKSKETKHGKRPK